MGSSRKRKPTKAPTKRAPDYSAIAPTPEQMAAREFVLEDITEKSTSGRMISIGKAYRSKPMIDTLHEGGYFTPRQHKALHRYRYMAETAGMSPIKDSLNKDIKGGSGMGPTAEYLTAVQVVRDCEAAAGQLRDILKAVVLEDMSLSEWARNQGGALQDGDRLKPKRNFLDAAQLEIKMVAVRVEAEMSA